jgi:putative tryptophan/tyrosine transport system substrate-binding protein
MRRLRYSRKLFFPLLAFLYPVSPVLGTDESVVAVLSSPSAPYREAFEGFQEAFGRTIPSVTLSEKEPKISSRTRVIVAIGGKAALYRQYPEQALLIYCLAPGIRVKPSDHRGPLLKVHTNPAVPITLAKFKELQPGLKRLGILWSSDSIKDYFLNKSDIASNLGIEMISEHVANARELPDRLRSLKGRVDALWIPPDAAMVTPDNFSTIKGFALANQIPFYVPSDGLVEQGAVASVYSSFKDIGALAAKMAHQALQGKLQIDTVFPETLGYGINLTSARQCHMTFSDKTVKQAGKVVP